jgi:hypothetical protein
VFHKFNSFYLRITGVLLLLAASSKITAFHAFIKSIPTFFHEPLWITAVIGICIIAFEVSFAIAALALGNCRSMIRWARLLVLFFILYNILGESGVLAKVFVHRGGCACTPSLYTEIFLSRAFTLTKLVVFTYLVFAAKPVNLAIIETQTKAMP